MGDVPDFRPDPSLFPFESRWLEVEPPGSRGGTLRLHHIDEGRGPALLLLHGNPTWSFLYREIVRRLRDGHRCVALDYPGFGLSERPASYGDTPAEHAAVVRDVVRRLDLRDLTVVGHDWGGPIGMRVALDEPGRVRALVMGNTWYWPVESLRIRAFSLAMSTPPARWLVRRRNWFVEGIMPRAVARPLPEEVMEHYRRVLDTPERRSGAAELPRQLRRAGPWLREIAAAVPRVLGDRPLLLTWGMGDPAFRPRTMERFRRDFASVRETPLRAKHYIQEDAPGAIADAIADFIADFIAGEGTA